jgi:uncharacterized protein (DUF2235 family)
MTGRLWAALSFLAPVCSDPFFQTAGEPPRVGVGLRRNVIAIDKFVCRNDRDADEGLFGFGFSGGGFTIRIVRIHILWKLAHTACVSLASRACAVQILRCSAFVAKNSESRT